MFQLLLRVFFCRFISIQRPEREPTPRPVDADLPHDNHRSVYDQLPKMNTRCLSYESPLYRSLQYTMSDLGYDTSITCSVKVWGQQETAPGRSTTRRGVGRERERRMKPQLECVIVPSFGKDLPSNVAVKKSAGDFLQGVGDDLKIIQRMIGDDSDKELASVELMCHFERVKVSTFLERIRDMMTRLRLNSASNKKGLLIWYSGHGMQVNGDWVFEDGCLTFEAIYTLYKSYFKGHHLYIVSDCCYSGAWVVECARLLDRDGIGCGHEAERQQVFVKVFTSCLPNEFAYDRFYTACKGVRLSKDCRSKTIKFAKHRKIHHGDFNQTTLAMDFTLDNTCIVDSHGVCHPRNTWTWQVQNLIYEDTSKQYLT